MEISNFDDLITAVLHCKHLKLKTWKKRFDCESLFLMKARMRGDTGQLKRRGRASSIPGLPEQRRFKQYFLHGDRICLFRRTS
jgi:hypothetical protein